MHLPSSLLFRSALVALTLVSSGTLFAQVTMQSRYDLSGTVSSGGSVVDSVSGFNGTLLASGTISGGVLTLAGTAVATTGVALPTSATSSLTGSFSVEAWFTQTTVNTWQAVFGFSNGNKTAPYDILIGSGSRGSGQGFGVGIGNNAGVGSGTTVTANTLYDMIVTYNAGTGLVTVYNNGVSVKTGTVTGFNLSTITGGGIGGGGYAAFNDTSIVGSVADFRLYNGELSSSQVSAIYGLGSDATDFSSVSGLTLASAIPEPSTYAAIFGVIALGGVVVLKRRRKTLA